MSAVDRRAMATCTQEAVATSGGVQVDGSSDVYKLRDATSRVHTNYSGCMNHVLYNVADDMLIDRNNRMPYRLLYIYGSSSTTRVRLVGTHLEYVQTRTAADELFCRYTVQLPGVKPVARR